MHYNRFEGILTLVVGTPQSSAWTWAGAGGVCTKSKSSSRIGFELAMMELQKSRTLSIGLGVRVWSGQGRRRNEKIYDCCPNYPSLVLNKLAFRVSSKVEVLGAWLGREGGGDSGSRLETPNGSSRRRAARRFIRIIKKCSCS